MPRTHPLGHLRPATARAATLLLASLSAMGCGGGVGDITGEVRYQGKGVPWGRITFLTQTRGQQAYSGPIDNGVYSLEGVPTGPVKILVESFAPKASNPLPKGIFPMPDREPEKPLSVLPPFVPIPPRYRHLDQSELTYVVLRGDQTHDLDLEP